MNWLTRLIPSIGKSSSKSKKSKIPDGVWTSCPSCESALYKPELLKTVYVCPKCDHHLRVLEQDLIFFLTMETLLKLHQILRQMILLILKTSRHILQELRKLRRILVRVKLYWLDLANLMDG